MYPKLHSEYFREFEGSDEVFVAMPFSDEFDARWESIFIPAIESEAVGLRPYRVNVKVVSDSILMDILQGIGRAKLVLADISTEKADWPNPNVMYELGLAQAMRLPEEVVVVRGDKEDPPFDVRHIRAHRFDPNNIAASRDRIAKLLADAIIEIDRSRYLIVGKTLRALAPEMVYVMAMEHSRDMIDPPRASRGGYGWLEWSETRAIFWKLVELGVFETFSDPVTRNVYYKWTGLGRVLATRLEDVLARIREA